MRLIDVDDLQTRLYKLMEQGELSFEVFGEVGSVLDEQPIAYDVDKVVEKVESRKMQSNWRCSSNAVSCRDPRECKQCSLGESCRGCQNQFTELCSRCRNRKELRDIVEDMQAELDRYREIGSIQECRKMKENGERKMGK